MFLTQFGFLAILATSKGLYPEQLSADDFARAEFFIFAFMAIINAVVGYMLPKFLVKGSLRGRTLKNEVEVLQVTFPAMIIRLAIIEAVSLFGFVAAMQAEKGAMIFPFTFLAILLFLLSYPRYELLRSWTR